VAALSLERDAETMLFIVGAGVVLLVFVGIHNAWHTVTHVTIQRLGREKTKNQASRRGQRDFAACPPGRPRVIAEPEPPEYTPVCFS
jgi:hypothetical protein